MASPPLLLIVTGLPASGKTTLARRLSSELGLPCLYKDDLKETLMEQLGTHDRAWSQRLGAVSIALLWHLTGTLLERGVGLMVECNFDPRLAAGQLRELRERADFQLVQIECRAEPDELIRRFQARLAHRHPGHMDDQNAEAHAALSELNPSLLIDWPGERLTFQSDAEPAEPLLLRLHALLSA